ncbi:Phosphotransferase enzyme [Mycoblastus sanguinarius]|nr:Phosphotransferase enzyme [Mycoblastus sanguinarius]
MRWRYRGHFDLAPYCITDPDLELIREVVRPYIKLIVPGADTVSVAFLARGAFNQAYTVTAENSTIGFSEEFVFRVALPLYPYYKAESDVATTEFVRRSTTIQVPIIYAFDSSSDNKLGFEWMLMEKVKGRVLEEVWDSLGYKAKENITIQVAGWADELSRSRFNKIGSIYMRHTPTQLEFYLGPLMDYRLYEGDRLLHEVYRGPFESLQALYTSVLKVTEWHVNDPRHKSRHEMQDAFLDGSKVQPLGNKPDRGLMDTSANESLQPHNTEEMLAPAERVDRDSERRWGVSKSDLSWLPEDLKIYRLLLPHLCPLPHAPEIKSTMLSHPDLSMFNLFVDDSGSLVTLIDWEMARVEPVELVQAIPDFLDEDDVVYAPPDSEREAQKISASSSSDQNLEMLKKGNEKSCRWLKDLADKTKLRALYRQDLQQRDSPLCEALDRDPESLEQELVDRVYYPHYPRAGDAWDWGMKHLGDSFLEDSDSEEQSDCDTHESKISDLDGKDGNVDLCSVTKDDECRGNRAYESSPGTETAIAMEEVGRKANRLDVNEPRCLRIGLHRTASCVLIHVVDY